MVDIAKGQPATPTSDRVETPLDKARKEREKWEAEGRPAPEPSGEPATTGKGRATTQGAVVKSELAKTEAELEAGLVQQQIKQGKMPEGSSVLSRNADGTPETYEYGGKVYYAPGSVQYETGWRSREDYMRGQHLSAYGGEEGSKVPKDAVKVDVERAGQTISVHIPTDKPVKHRQVARLISRGQYGIPVEVQDATGRKGTRYITPDQQAKLDKLKGKDQFNYMVQLGMIPQGSTFGRTLEEGRGWTYNPPPIKTRVDQEQIDLAIQYEAQQMAMEQLAPYLIKRQVRDGQISTTPPGYDIVGYLRDYPEGEQLLYDAGFSLRQVKEAKQSVIELAKFEEQQRIALARKGPLETVIRRASQVKTHGDIAEFGKWGAVVAAEVLVPGVYVARNWNDLSIGERALWIAVDVASLVPFVGAGVRGARVGATAGRAAMARGIVAGTGREAVAMAKAPVTVILHPIGTAKATYRQIANLAENIGHWRKVPYAVLTTSEGTVRIPVTKGMTKAEVMAARDILMEKALKGERIFVQVGDQIIEMASSPFMREVRKAGGGLVHATPDIETFVGGVKVRVKPGMPAREQGWFLSHEPVPRFTTMSAFGKGTIPIPKTAVGKVLDIGQFRSVDIVGVDKAPIRQINFADAVNIPDDLAPALQKYAQREGAILYGSFNEWLKLKNAIRPNDIDLVFRNSDKAITDILSIIRRAGYQARRVPRGIEILKDGKWVKIADTVNMSQHRKMLPGIAEIYNTIDGLKVETLGKQYIGQSFGAVKEGAKALTRERKLELAAGEVKKLLKAKGASKIRPGFFITSRETAMQSIATGKIYRGTAEAERKLVVGAKIPEPKQKLFTRLGPNADRVEIYLENPLSARQIAKLKAEGLIETLKAPFKPALTIKSVTGQGLSIDKAQRLAKALREAGNVEQAAELLRLERSAVMGRLGVATPRSLASVLGRVERADIMAARERLLGRQLAELSPELGRYERIPGETPRLRRLGRGERIGGRAPRIETTIARMGRVGRAERGERPPARPERGERPPTRPKRGERPPTRPERPERPPSRPERPVRPPQRPERSERPPDRPDRPPSKGRLLETRSPTRQAIAPGSIAFAMGKRMGPRGIMVSQWYYIPPPYDQNKPMPLDAPPKGARFTESANPYETIQVIGASRRYTVPESISFDLGITDGFITSYGTKISFSGKGTKTDVGTRLPETTRGMSVSSAMADELIDLGSYTTEPMASRKISRVSAPKKKPKRRNKQEDFSDLTSLKGFRF